MWRRTENSRQNGAIRWAAAVAAAKVIDALRKQWLTDLHFRLTHWAPYKQAQLICPFDRSLMIKCMSSQWLKAVSLCHSIDWPLSHSHTHFCWSLSGVVNIDTLSLSIDSLLMFVYLHKLPPNCLYSVKSVVKKYSNCRVQKSCPSAVATALTNKPTDTVVQWAPSYRWYALNIRVTSNLSDYNYTWLVDKKECQWRREPSVDHVIASSLFTERVLSVDRSLLKMGIKERTIRP